MASPPFESGLTIESLCHSSSCVRVKPNQANIGVWNRAFTKVRINQELDLGLGSTTFALSCEINGHLALGDELSSGHGGVRICKIHSSGGTWARSDHTR